MSWVVVMLEALRFRKRRGKLDGFLVWEHTGDEMSRDVLYMLRLDLLALFIPFEEVIFSTGTYI